MSEQRIREIKERLAAATPGPWELRDGLDVDYWDIHDGQKTVVGGGDYPPCGIEDGVFIAHAPDDISWLLQQLEGARVHVWYECPTCTAPLPNPNLLHRG